MSLPNRLCLALALAWAGGFGLPGPPGAELPLLAVAVALGWWLAPAEPRMPTSGSRWIAVLALALLLGLLARSLGRVLIASPAALWSVPIVALALVIGDRRPRLPMRAMAAALVGLALAAGVFGASFEARGPQAHGRVFGTPILGVHPRQALAVRIDGFGPHDIVVDDYVDPPGGQGYDPERWAARLEAELHAIAERNYADGPARAREAFSRATVEVREALVPPADRPLYTSLLGVEVRSGTAGEGSTVEFVCPGRALDPRGGSTSAAVGRSCPRKYLVDGSTGLGLASRFPGHTQVIGRDRARLARTLSWPSGDATRDRRALALESGLWLLAIVIGGWALGRVRRPSEATRPAAAAISIVTVGLLVLALLVSPGEAAIDRGGPTLLAILLVLVPARPSTPTRREVEPAALPCALLLALLAASPLAGRGDAVELLAITREGLVELGLGWSLASALAGSLATLALMIGAVTIGAVISTATRPDPSEPCGDRSPNTAARIRERRHEWIGLGLALACGVGLALRKPVDDLPLLQGAGALLVLASIRLRSPVQQLALTLACTALAAAPLLDGDARSPVAVGLVGLMALVCLGVGLAAARRAGSTEAPTHG